MAHLTPLALQLTNPSPSNNDKFTTGCSNFFKTNCPSKWLAEEYIKIDSTFDTYLDTLKDIGRKKISISAYCTNLYQYYQSIDGQKQLKLLKQQRSTLLSKEIAKSSTHEGVYDDINDDNNSGRNALWSDNRTSAKLNDEAEPNSSSSSEQYTMKGISLNNNAISEAREGVDSDTESPKTPSSNPLSDAQQSAALEIDEDPIADDDHKHVVSGTTPQKHKKKNNKLAKPFTEHGRRSFGERFNGLGKKWVLSSGTIVENVIFLAGNNDQEVYSFMLDLSDCKVEKLFSSEDWQEITVDLPNQEMYSQDVAEYMDKFADVKSISALEKALRERPFEPEHDIVYECLYQWLRLYKTTDPSPFSIIDSLGENWWLQNAWGATSRLADGIPYSFILTGSKACIDSTERRNSQLTATENKKVGSKADLIWRTIIAPEHDWGTAEAACEWDPIGQKYRYESTHKLPRQMHDILIGRAFELGKTDSLRNEYVSGLVFGGPVIQRFLLCWGTKGDNITRLIKLDERRISSSISLLSESIWGAHELMLFSRSTIRLIESYNSAKEEIVKQEQERRRAEMRSTS
ncbi:hypothetical protein BGZ46_003480, partial [Entomortierella lignicola]